MKSAVRLLLIALGATLAACAVFRRDPAPPVPLPADLTAPDSFDVEMTTTKGTMVVRSYRRWSPRGADRLYTLVRVGFFNDSVAFHRTINRFVAQFGIHGGRERTRGARLAQLGVLRHARRADLPGAEPGLHPAPGQCVPRATLPATRLRPASAQGSLIGSDYCHADLVDPAPPIHLPLSQ